RLAALRVYRQALEKEGKASTQGDIIRDRKSTRLNSSHVEISYAVFCLKKKIHQFFLCFSYVFPQMFLCVAYVFPRRLLCSSYGLPMFFLCFSFFFNNRVPREFYVFPIQVPFFS